MSLLLRIAKPDFPALRGVPGVRFAALRLAPPFCHDARVPPTVLIVDDHPSFRASARAILEADGFEIVARRRMGRQGSGCSVPFVPTSCCWTSSSRT